MLPLAQLLANQGFLPPKGATGRGSVADLFKPGQRCGVYVLLFGGGHAYVGQSVNVVRRYAEHLRTHQDIEAISFRETRPEELDESEQRTIRLVERCGHKLRNIVFSALPPAESDFDLIMSLDEQRVWLSDADCIDAEGARIVNADLRQKYAAKYRRLKMIDGIPAIIKKVRSYVRRGLPAIRRGEVSFWSLSCLPAFPNPEITLYMRLSVNWQEVLTVYREKQSGQDYFSLHVAQKPIEDDRRLRDEFPSLEFADHCYTPGGHDQIKITSPGSKFDALMECTAVRTAIRLFNHRLMKKGPCNFARYHCLDLADELIEG